VLRINTLGGLSITVSNQPIPRAVTAKGMALLVYLAITGRAHARPFLLALLWSGMEENEAQNNLRQALFQLKKYADPWLEVSRGAIGIAANQAVWVDALALERGEGPDDLSGEFLQGFSVRNAEGFEEWMAGQRSRFGEAAAQVLLNRARAAEKGHDLPAALAALNQLLQRDPWREEAHRAKMLLLAHNGQHSAALAQFATCKASLRSELAIDPAPATAQLAERIARAQTRPPMRWPQDGGRFVGREKELGAIAACFQREGARLVTVLGPGGMGKTRLALEAAKLLAPGFLEGVYHVPLQPLSTPADVLPAIAAAVGLAAARNPLGALGDFFRDKDALLLLDNAEHVLDAAEDLAKLMTRADGLRLLVTSREVLNLREEHVFPVSGLGTRDGDGPDDAAQLFITRARALLRDYAPDAAELAGIGRVCRFVEGMPLAIELASGMLRKQTAREIADHLERDLGALVSPLRDAPGRHKSMRAVYEQSLSVLEPAERDAALRLSVFRGGFGADAAAVVAGVAEPLLGALADKSFVRREGSFDGEARFSLHGVLRAFGEEALGRDGQADGLRARHAEYYAERVAARFDSIVRADQARILRDLQRDDANLALAWEHAATLGNSSVAQRMLPALFRYVNVLSKAVQWLPRVEAARAALCADDSALCHMLATRLAGMLNFLGDYARARALTEPAQQAFAGAGLTAEADFARLILGNGHLAQGHLTEAEPYYLDLLGAPDEFIAQAALANLAIIDTRKGDLVTALARMDQSRAANKRLGNLRGEAIQALNMADALYRQGELARSAALLDEAGQLFALVQDPIGSARTAGNLGELLQEMGKLEEAAEQFARVLRMCRDLGMQHMVISMLGSLAHVRFLQGRLEEAEAPLGECLALAHAIEAVDQIAIHTQTEVKIALARRDVTAARPALQTALRAAITTEETQQQISCLLLLVQVWQATGRPADASQLGQALLGLPDLRADAQARLHALGYRVPAAHAIDLSVLGARALEQLRGD
jgi:predicted ATPase/DNA-binding SARP family transcriptional activator